MSKRKYLGSGVLLMAMATTTMGGQIEFELGDVIYENPLASPEDIEDWVIESSKEGHPAITFPHDRMRMESDVHFLLWSPEEFPDNIAVSWEFRPRVDEGLAMFWIAATGREGQSIFDPELEERDGTYSQYMRGDINGLHVSYFRRNHPGSRDGFHEINFQTSNLRKSHGFHLVAESGDPLPSAQHATRPYQMQVIKYGPHFRFTINDLTVIDWYDDGQETGPVLEGGRIGFRQMAGLIADYANLQVREVTSARSAHLPSEVYQRLGAHAQHIASASFPADGWRFRLDPADEGEAEQWYVAEADESDWQNIQTEQHWQNAGHDYVGPAWYRRTIDWPLEETAEAAVLHFQGVDESARVWVNGKFVGEHDIGPAGWDEPFTLDVTDQVNPGRTNQITIKAVSTAHMGGIWQPIELRLYGVPKEK